MERGHHGRALLRFGFIVRPATPEDEIKKVLTVIEHTCAEKGGKIEKTEHWGTRKLAYPRGEAPRRHLRSPDPHDRLRRAGRRSRACRSR